MIPIALPTIGIPTVVILLTGVAYLKRRPQAEMTEEQTKIYKAALSGALKDPVKLRKLADAFASQGFMPQARLLRQRAALRELPEATKVKRRQCFRDALKSKNRTGVLKLADAYEKEGCTSAAARLRDYASGLEGAPS